MNYLSSKKTYLKTRTAWLNGFIGMLIFSGSLPATKLAVLDLSPWFVTVARAAIAGILALVTILILKLKLPKKKHLLSFITVTIGVVIGFPLLSALALQHITSAHSLVFLGILPLLTAIFGSIRENERPQLPFWLFSILGSSLVIGFAVAQGISASSIGDLYMLVAVTLCALGYAEGAKLSKTFDGLHVISWALVISLPAMLPLMFLFMPNSLVTVGNSALAGLGYVSIFSMFVGFIFWYRGLAVGGTASVAQLQLLQPFFGLMLAAVLLHEEISAAMLAVTIGVVLCIVASRKFTT